MILRKLIAISSISTIALSLPVQGALAQDYDGIGRNPVLTPTEQQALAVAKQWQDTGTAGKPFRGPNGEVTFVFGIHQPTIVCAIFQVCILTLQPGEVISAKNLGDSARWDVSESLVGTGADLRTALAIKPKDAGLRTAFAITTSKRVYNIQLVSTRNQYMSLVSFSYQDEVTAKNNAIKAYEAQQRQAQTLPTGEYLGDLSFEYEIRESGKPRFKPARVYNDGVKTIIQMPRAMAQGEAPTLLVLGDDPDDKTLVNYRLQGDRFIVDGLFERAELISGVGRRQSRVMINRVQKPARTAQK